MEMKEDPYAVLDGPMGKLFFRFVKRKRLLYPNHNPYGAISGGIYRAARMIDIGDPWQLVFLAAAPAVVLLTAFQQRLGMPKHFQGFSLVLLTCYVGAHFVIWVFLDRRLDDEAWTRMRGRGRDAVDQRDTRLLGRRAAAQDKVENAKRVAEARKRGQMKARQGRAAPTRRDQQDDGSDLA